MPDGYLTTLPQVRAEATGDHPAASSEVDTGNLCADQIVRWRDDAWSEETLPKRPWIARGYLLRGQVTVVGGAGGAGKSMLILGLSVACALDTAWGRFKPEHPCRVVVLNAKDDDDEQRLRLSAALRQHHRTPADLAGKLARVSLPTGAKLVHFNPTTGSATPTPAMELLNQHLERFAPEVLALDPLIELHDAPENDNAAFGAACRVLRDLGRRHGCAVILAHHVRKGGAEGAGDPDIIRGGTALVGMSRVTMTVCVMTKAEAQALAISTERRRFYFRVDDAKGNYAPPGEADWFERQEIWLKNGESAPAAIPWAAPAQSVTQEQCLELLRLIAAAPEPLSPSLSKHARSFRNACLAVGVRTTDGQNDALKRLQRDHGVSVAKWVPRRKSAKDALQGLRTGDRQPAGVRWIDDDAR